MSFRTLSALWFCLYASYVIGQIASPIVLCDLNTNAPVEFAHVYLLDHSGKGTVTNADGQFLIPKCKSGSDTVAFSRIGYPIFKLSYPDLKGRDTVFLQREAIPLSEVVFYSHESILKKVAKNLASNYPTTSTNENYFTRYFAKRDTDKVQIIESITTLDKHHYFGENTDRSDQITLLSNKNIENKKVIDKMEFIPYSYHKLFSGTDELVAFNEDYDYFTEKVSPNSIRISFSSIDPKITKTGAFKGYLVINTEDYAMLEYFYQKEYNDKSTAKELKKDYYQKATYHSKRRIWEKDNLTGNYQLKLMSIEGGLIIENHNSDLKNSYEFEFLVQSLDDHTHNDSYEKVKIRNKKKAVNSYKNLNLDLINNSTDRIMIKTKEQREVMSEANKQKKDD